MGWIKAFFSNKKEYVEISDKKSKLLDIKCGLLQGDNLSQTLFSIIINGVTNVIKHCKHHLHADDQSIYFHTNINKLNNAIEIIDEDVFKINE